MNIQTTRTDRHAVYATRRPRRPPATPGNKQCKQAVLASLTPTLSLSLARLTNALAKSRDITNFVGADSDNFSTFASCSCRFIDATLPCVCVCLCVCVRVLLAASVEEHPLLSALSLFSDTFPSIWCLLLFLFYLSWPVISRINSNWVKGREGERGCCGEYLPAPSAFYLFWLHFSHLGSTFCHVIKSKSNVTFWRSLATGDIVRSIGSAPKFSLLICFDFGFDSPQRRLQFSTAIFYVLLLLLLLLFSSASPKTGNCYANLASSYIDGIWHIACVVPAPLADRS